MVKGNIKKGTRRKDANDEIREMCDRFSAALLSEDPNKALQRLHHLPEDPDEALRILDLHQTNNEDMSELKKNDPELWKPHPPTEICPLCLVPMPIEPDRSSYFSCCGKNMCFACKAETDRALATRNRRNNESKLPPMDPSCAFCGMLAPKTDSEMITRYEERVDKGDVKAMVILGGYYRDGECGLARDDAKGLELYRRAADLGYPKALTVLGHCLDESYNEEKGWVCIEDAAKKGDVDARYELGMLEEKIQGHDLAMKHYRLAAAAGHKEAMKRVKQYASRRKLSKAELDETKKAHKEACDEMSSEDRERYMAYEEVMARNNEALKNIYKCYYEGKVSAEELKNTMARVTAKKSKKHRKK